MFSSGSRLKRCALGPNLGCWKPNVFNFATRCTLPSAHCDRSLCRRPFGGLLKQLESAAVAAAAAAACLSPPKVFTHTGRGFKAIKWECRKQTQPNLSIFSNFLVLYLRTCSLIWFLYQKETIDNMGTFLICRHLWVTVHWQLSFYPFT